MPNKMALQTYCDMLGLYAAQRPDDTKVWWSFTERPYLSNGGYTLQDGAKTAKILSKNVAFPKCNNWRESLHSPHGENIVDFRIVRRNPEDSMLQDYMEFDFGLIEPKITSFIRRMEEGALMKEFRNRRKEAIIKELAEMVADGKVSVCSPRMSLF